MIMNPTKSTTISTTGGDNEEEEDEVLYFSLSSSSNLSDNNKDEDSKIQFIPSKPRLLTEGSLYHKPDHDEQQSDFLDSLQILSISLQDEINLIQQYFPAIITLIEDESMSHDATIIDFIINSDDPLQIQTNSIDLSIVCNRYYPKEEHTCHCRTLTCALISPAECTVLKNKLNLIAQQLTKERHNCMIMMLIELEKRLSNLNTKGMNLQNTDMSQMPARNTSVLSGLGTMRLLNNSGFFDSLNSLHDVATRNLNKQKQEHILPSSFTALQDIQTTKTKNEKAVEDTYAKTDRNQLCPKMCGAVWGANGQLIFFNNILIKRHRNGRKLSLQQDRNSMVSLHDYNQFIEKCGADGIHSEELHSIRKRVFANHFDEDEDRFADEFVVGFSLYHQSQSNKLLQNGGKSTRHYPYKNAYLHRSLSFLHQQHHHPMRYPQSATMRHQVIRSHDHPTTHHGHPHIKIPRLVLPSTLHHHQNSKSNGRNHPRKKRYRHHDRSRKYKATNGRNAHHMTNKQGNARVFCPGVIRFMVRFPFSKELISLHKLSVDVDYNVSSLCVYNAKECKSLGLNRLSKVLNILSTFLETASPANTLIPSPYHHNYMAKFVQKAVDELYMNNEMQGIAIIACLLRQSQFFVLLFFSDTSPNYCGYLLQRCVAHYLRLIQDRMSHDQIKDLYQLQHFTELLNAQKTEIMPYIHGDTDDAYDDKSNDQNV
eukprot:210741_1